MYRPKSTWISAVKSPKLYPKVGPSHDKQHFDVIVVGAGIVGTTTAYLLKKAGKKVCLLEGHRVGYGATSSSTAKLSAQQGCLYQQLFKSHGPEKARMYYDMNMEGIELIESISRSVSCDFARKQHITWSNVKENLGKIQKELEVCRELNIPCQWWEPEDLRSELPASIGALNGIAFVSQAQFNPYKYCIGLAEMVHDENSCVFEESRVTDVTAHGTHKVTVNEIELTSSHVVLATHLPFMDRSLHFALLEPTRTVCVAFELKEGSHVVNQMSINAETPTRSLRSYGNSLIVAGEGFKMGEESSEESYEKLERWTKSHFDVVQVLSRWSAMDYVSSDHVPFIGQLYRGSSSIYTATGFSKWGLANGAIAAKIIADLIQNKVNAYTDLVDAKRWDLMHQWKGLALENIHTQKHLVSDKIKHQLKADDIAHLKVGQGKICKIQGKKVGAYLDEKNQYHLVEPVCTHLGCDLVFNDGDKIWDCPCHGSHFDIDGNVLHGPAVKALKQCKDLTW
jgi:glycine/D-amino acid oxidase-like deaminating enzyme/nitrite reductase/ring-hydroxylating ferredoxin subunit